MHSQASAGLDSAGDSEEGPLPCLFLASGGSWHPWHPLVCNCITLPPSSHGLLPVSLWVLSYSYKNTRNWG